MPEEVNTYGIMKHALQNKECFIPQYIGKNILIHCNNMGKTLDQVVFGRIVRTSDLTFHYCDV
jgi:hypothetical protein